MNQNIEVLKKELLEIKELCQEVEEIIDFSDEKFESAVKTGLINDMLEDHVIFLKINMLNEEISNLNTIIHLLYEFYGVNSKTHEIKKIFEDLLNDKAELDGKNLYLNGWYPYNKINSVNIKTGE